MPYLVIGGVGAHAQTHKLEMDDVGSIPALKGVIYRGGGIDVKVMI